MLTPTSQFQGVEVRSGSLPRAQYRVIPTNGMPVRRARRRYYRRHSGLGRNSCSKPKVNRVKRLPVLVYLSPWSPCRLVIVPKRQIISQSWQRRRHDRSDRQRSGIGARGGDCTCKRALSRFQIQSFWRGNDKKTSSSQRLNWQKSPLYQESSRFFDVTKNPRPSRKTSNSSFLPIKRMEGSEAREHTLPHPPPHPPLLPARRAQWTPSLFPSPTRVICPFPNWCMPRHRHSRPSLRKRRTSTTGERSMLSCVGNSTTQAGGSALLHPKRMKCSHRDPDRDWTVTIVLPSTTLDLYRRTVYLVLSQTYGSAGVTGI